MARKTSRTDKPADLTERIVDAALTLAATRPWQEVRLSDIAAEADVSLADLRERFDGKLDILAAFSRRIDREVLERLDPDLAQEPVRERLFDVLMARFDALQPYRAAVASIVRSFEARPGDLLMWNRVAVRSMVWMLEAAGIDTSSRLGAIGAQGMVGVYGRTLRVWLTDDDPGMARTMVELDRRLTEGGRWMGRIERLCSLAEAFGRLRKARRSRFRGRREGYGEPDAEMAGSGI